MASTAKEFEVPYWPNQITKYAKNRLAGMNMSESARRAGYSPALVNQAGRLIEPKAQRRIKEALEAKGVTTDVLADVIEQGLSATRESRELGRVADYKERREYTRLSLEALGELKTGATVAVQINLPNGFLDAWGEE